MPLRDHFRPPLDLKRSWDELHGMWPATIVQRLNLVLPMQYAAGPGVHLGAFEIDVSAYERPELEEHANAPNGAAGGVAVAAQPVLAPTLSAEVDSLDQDEYEVRVYDNRHGRKLVAAVEIVSPSNKDRPESRRVFVAKCAALLNSGVCVSIVDVVTVKQFNLYAELLELVGATDPTTGREPPPVYAATLRARKRQRKKSALDAWFYPLVLGQPLPAPPLWLDTDLSVSLDLEGSYEDACRVLRIT